MFNFEGLQILTGHFIRDILKQIMGELAHPKKKEIKGPWLLNHDDFEALDLVIRSIDNFLYDSWEDTIISDIKKEHKKILDKDLNRKINEYKKDWKYDKHTKECQITSKDGTKLRGDSISAILKHPAINNLEPKSLDVYIGHGPYWENTFELKISKFYRGELSYDINCSHANNLFEIQYNIDQWIDKRKPKRALKFWSNYGDWFTFPLIIPIIYIGIQSFSTTYTTYQETIGLEMFELAKEGINETNRDLALELLVKSQSGFRPNDFVPQEKSNDPIWIRILAVILFVFIAAIFRPKTLIGLGKMKNVLNVYKIWIKLVLITLPTVLVIAPFWKTIVKWFY